MKKFLLLSTIFVAGTAFAFGGIGIGHKSSSHKPGVDAIGIHIDPNGKKANIDIIDGDSPKECGFGWTLNTETNECECPEERICGETCCGEGNVCNQETNECCFAFYKEWGMNYACCNANESLGFAAEMDNYRCCPAGEFPYFIRPGDCGDDCSSCCDGVVFRRGNSEDQICCPKTSTYVNDFGECCGGNNVDWVDAEEHARCHAAEDYCIAIEGDTCVEYGTCAEDQVLMPYQNIAFACCVEGETAYCSRGDGHTQTCLEIGCCPPGETCETGWDY